MCYKQSQMTIPNMTTKTSNFNGDSNTIFGCQRDSEESNTKERNKREER
jgi:hypothetical protein